MRRSNHKRGHHAPPARLGLLDWGVGGLGVLQAIRRVVSDVPVLYWSDTGSAPYGKMKQAALEKRVRAVLARMMDEGATHIVIACNAASTVRDQLGDLPVPVTGMIEHAGRVIPRGFTGTLGVIGGGRTIRSGLYPARLQRPGLQIVQRVAQPLSAHIEAGRIGGHAFLRDLERIVHPLRRAGGVLLACTHYPAAHDAIARALPGVQLFDPATAVAEAVKRWTLSRAWLDDVYVTTGDPGAMRRAAAQVWNLKLDDCQHRTL